MTTRRQPNFDPVARLYRWAEYLALGSILNRARTHFLPHLTSCRQALVLGDGDGRFLARLLQQSPGLHALAVDTSRSMLHLLRKRCQSSKDRLQTLQASALDVLPPPGTDLIVTHFFLDCLTQSEVDHLVANLHSKLASSKLPTERQPTNPETLNTLPGVFWLLSDFAIPQHRFLRPLARAYVCSLYFAFRILTGLRVTHLPDPQTPLAAHGFVRLTRREFLFGLVYTELWKR